MKIRNTIFVLALLVSASANAGGIIGDMLESLGGDLGNIGKELDQAHRSIKEPVKSYKSLEEAATTPASIAAVEKARKEAELKTEDVSRQIRMAETKLQEVNTKLLELGKLSRELEQEKLKIKEDRDRIAGEKSDIEQREKLFSMGFYASLLTAGIAGFGLFVRIPTSRLEQKLKLIEIEHKQIELQKLKESTT